MAPDWTPDEKYAREAARYKQAKKTERELKPTIRAGAVDELKRGATPAQLAELTGESGEVFRRLREEHGIAVDPRYESRAELARARKKAAPTLPPAAPAPAKTAPRKAASRHPSPEPEYGGVDLAVAQSCADLAYDRATPEQILRLNQVKGAAKDGEQDYAVAEAAYKMGLVTDADIAAAKKGDQ